MPSQQTKSLPPQSKEILNRFEFRVNTDFETRPTLEYRRIGDFHWHELALVQPGSNYYILLATALVDAGTFEMDVVQEEER